MILLRDTVEIEASPEQIFDWLAHFQENYLTWHPDHVECRYLQGTSILEEGSVLYIEEVLHGQLHRLNLRATQVTPNTRLEYQAGFGIGGAFEIKPRGDYVAFVADVTLGLETPLLGWIIDWVMQKLMSSRLEAMKQHMAEEGKNLKQWLERGKPAVVR